MKRLWGKAELNDNGCFVWTAAKIGDGYGRISVNNQNKLAHRVAYGEVIGEIPDGLTVDHLCRNKSCINPMHMELVTLKENIQRRPQWQSLKTHCKNGHEFTDTNTYKYSGFRYCKQCRANRRYSITKQLAKKGRTS